MENMASLKRFKVRRPKNEAQNLSNLSVPTYSSFDCKPIQMGVSWGMPNNNGQSSTPLMPITMPVMSSQKGKLKHNDNQGSNSKLSKFMEPLVCQDFSPTGYLFHGLTFANMNIFTEFIRVHFHYITPWIKSHNWTFCIVIQSRNVICININHTLFPDFVAIFLQVLYEVKSLPLEVIFQYITPTLAQSQRSILAITKDEMNVYALRIAHSLKDNEEKIPSNMPFNLHTSVTETAILFQFNELNGISNGHNKELPFASMRREEKSCQTESEPILSFEQHLTDMVRNLLKMSTTVKEMRQNANSFGTNCTNADTKQEEKITKVDQDMEMLLRRPEDTSIYFRTIRSRVEYVNASTQTCDFIVEEDLLEVLDETEILLLEETFEKIIMCALKRIIGIQKKINHCKQETEKMKLENLKLLSEIDMSNKFISTKVNWLSRSVVCIENKIAGINENSI